MEKLCKRCPQAPDCHLDYLQENAGSFAKEKAPISAPTEPKSLRL